MRTSHLQIIAEFRFVTIIARFIMICLALASLVYGAMWALAVFVEPEVREIVINVPASKFVK